MMVRQQPAPDFLVAGGDWFGHVDESRRTEAAVANAAVILARVLDEHFGRVPVVHAIGNHASVSQADSTRTAGHTMPPSVGNHDSWPYYSAAPTAASWDAAWGSAYARRTFPGAARAQWVRGGYYARRVGPALLALMLNTNSLSLGADVDDQLSWLEVTPSHSSHVPPFKTPATTTGRPRARAGRGRLRDRRGAHPGTPIHLPH